MTKSTRRFTAAALFGTVTATVLGMGAAFAPAGAAFPDTPYPQIVLDHTVRTKPFAGSTVSMHDHEGSTYVARDTSLWLADDSGHKIYEIDPFNGTLKRFYAEADFTQVRQLGGGPLASIWRDRDLESMAYDGTKDILYAFSGSCCTTEELPTVWRLKRDKHGVFKLDSYQPLPTGSDFTGAAWNPADGKLYVGVGPDLRTYDYETNTVGATFQVPKLTRITGLQFSPSGADLWVTHAGTRVSRVSWATKTLVAGWSWDLSPFGVLDARAVEVFNDQLWISDGYDFRDDGDPLDHALFVFDLTKPPPDYNIVGNGTFEDGTKGWNANGTAGITLDNPAGGHSGSFAARLTNDNATATTMTLNDVNPNWVPTTAVGTYTATAWVRSDTGTGKAYVRIREYDGSTLVVLASSVVTLSPNWQQVTVSMSPQAAGSSTLDLNVYVSGAPAGTNLYVDDVALNFQ
jgi:hypothetical protein